jgi:cell wall-associated NlpC family hydrolase
MAEADGAALARAAEALIGTPFRCHGRDPASGLDCIGLVFASLAAIGRMPVAPAGYAMRNQSIDHWLGCAPASGLAAVKGQIARGDVLLMQPSAVQHHLMIAASADSVIHAHAGLRRVVCQPLANQPAITAHWRLAPFVQGHTAWRL